MDESFWTVVSGLLALVTLLGILWRVSGARKTLHRLRVFLLDWLGEPARPGVKARPGFPERMASVEVATKMTSATLENLTRQAAHYQASLEKVSAQLDGLDRRVQGTESDMEKLKRYVEHRLAALYPESIELQNKMMRAVLTELGLDMELPAPPAAPTPDDPL
jgi:hypothetical protein